MAKSPHQLLSTLTQYVGDGGCFCEEASQEVLRLHVCVSACVCVRVSFLNRHLHFSCIYITDLFTNKIQLYILKTTLNMLS